MEYILQHAEFGLGNFINLTPAIMWLSQQKNEPIPVFFETDYVRQCFLDCQFIRILDEKPEHGPLFTSGLINPENDKPDYQYTFEFVSGSKWTPEYHTYVDMPSLDDYPFLKDLKHYILLINGSGNNSEEYVSKKDPGQLRYISAYSEIRKKYGGLQVVCTGSKQDAIRNGWMKDYVSFWGDIRVSLALMSSDKCAFVVSNDTGLAHAAGAMNKDLTVLWKDTPKERCKNAGTYTKYLYGL